MEDFTYKCDDCCACCMFWNPARYDPSLVDEFGICKHLDLKAKRCTIYKERPLFCRVNEWYDVVNKQNSISYEEFIRQVHMGCDILKTMEEKGYEVLLNEQTARRRSQES